MAELRQLKADTEEALQAEYDKGAQYVVNKYIGQLDWVRSDSFHKGWTAALKHAAVPPEDAAWGFNLPGPKPVDSDDEGDVLAEDLDGSTCEEEDVVAADQEGSGHEEDRSPEE